MDVTIFNTDLLGTSTLQIDTDKGIITINVGENEIFMSVNLREGKYIGQCHLNMVGHELLLERMKEVLDEL